MRIMLVNKPLQDSCMHPAHLRAHYERSTSKGREADVHLFRFGRTSAIQSKLSSRFFRFPVSSLAVLPVGETGQALRRSLIKSELRRF